MRRGPDHGSVPPSPDANDSLRAAESKVHSFIVKLWQEDDETGKYKWHGYVTHVPDVTRRYLKDLCEIIDFIEPYLRDGTTEGMSVFRRGWLSWTRRKR